MKKVLLATTMLYGAAGFAAAEVTLSGDARMGIVSNGTDANFSSRARVSFNMSGETDGGLSFGASFRADNAGGAASGIAGSVFIAGMGHKLTMGAPAGAAEAAVGDLHGVGYIGVNGYDGTTGYIGVTDTYFISGDGFEGDFNNDEIVQYSYTMGNFSIFASLTDSQYTPVPGFALDPITNAIADEVVAPTDYKAYAVGAAYNDGTYNFGVGYERADGLGGWHDSADQVTTHVALGAGATFGQVAVKAIYGTFDIETSGVKEAEGTQYGVSAQYSADALTLTGYFKDITLDDAAGVEVGNLSSYGVGVGYDLGGGAVLRGMVANVERTGALGAFDDTVADVGVNFSF